MKRKNLRSWLNILIAILVAYGYYLMIFHAEGPLQGNGMRSLKYFTVLSNLFEGAACIYFLLHSNQETDAFRDVLKYVASCAVTLTLIVVLVFLGPIFGYTFMFRGANFYFHLLIPLLAIGEFVVFNETKMEKRENGYMMLPIFLYGIYYLGNIALNGIGVFPNKNDWYGFFLFGNIAAVFIIMALFGGDYLIGTLLRKINNRMHK